MAVCKKICLKILFCFVLSIPAMGNLKAQICSGSWDVGTTLNYICIFGKAIGQSNSSLEPPGCPVNPTYTAGQFNTFTFDNPVESFTMDFKSFSTAASCARIEIKINGMFYPLTPANIVDIPLVIGCQGSFSFIAITNDGYITSTINSLSSSNGHGRIIINGVIANNVTISTNDPLGTIVSTPFSCIPVVPLKLIKFEGQNDICKVILNWETGIEFNIKNIEIQRSENGILFYKLDEIDPKGSNSLYSFATANTTDAFFRLKINDQDGYYEYSEIIYIKSSCNQSNYQVNPNPTRDLLRVIGLKNGDQILVTDMLGRIALTFKSQQNNNIFDIQALATGMYIVQVINTGIIKATLKVFKQ